MSDEPTMADQRRELRLDSSDWVDFVVIVERVETAVAYFKAYEVAAQAGDDGTLEFHRAGASNGMDVTAELPEADVYADVSIKWDGCGNMELGEKGYFHFCGIQHAAKLGKLLTALYAMAYELIPSTSKDKSDFLVPQEPGQPVEKPDSDESR